MKQLGSHSRATLFGEVFGLDAGSESLPLFDQMLLGIFR